MEFIDTINLLCSGSALDRLSNLILEKNTNLMSQIFILMFKAKNNKDDYITLTLEDIKKLEKSLVSPKDIYLNVLNYVTNNKLGMYWINSQLFMFQLTFSFKYYVSLLSIVWTVKYQTFLQLFILSNIYCSMLVLSPNCTNKSFHSLLLV